MTKTFIYCLLPLLLLSFNTQADSIAAVADGAAVAEGQVIKKVGKTTAKIMVARSILKNKKLIIGGTLVIGVGGFITHEKFIDMIEHPEDHEDFMISLSEDMPVRYALFKKFIAYNIKNTDNDDYRENLLNFDNYFHISQQDKVYNKIKSSPQYSSYLAMIKSKVKTIQSDYKNDPNKEICNLAFYENFSHNFYDFDKKLKLYSDGNQNIYQVNRFGNFNNAKGSGITADHIPSYKAIEKFMRNKGVSNISMKRKENEILDSNSSAINILSIDHREGSKTFAGRNHSLISDQDSLDLLSASIDDITFFATFLIIEKKKDPTEYLKSSYVLLKRNFYLCLYEK